MSKNRCYACGNEFKSAVELVAHINQCKDVKGSPLARQEGGNHYKDLAIQPVEYIHRNALGFCEGSAVKYLTRWKAKGGVEDLRKAKHFIELLIEMESK